MATTAPLPRVARAASKARDLCCRSLLSRRRVANLGLLCMAAAPLGLSPRSHAQRPGTTYRVGFLGTNRRDSAAAPSLAAFETGLREHGWQPGVDVVVDYRASEGDEQRRQENAAEVVRAKVDVILAETNPHVAAARRLTSTIPIVMVAVTDPVGFGFVASLARPGGNVTGQTFDPGPELTTKPMQHLKEMRPGLARLAVLRMPDSPAWAPHDRMARQSAEALQLSIELLDANTFDEVDAAFASLKKVQVDALLCWFAGRGVQWRERVATMALQAGLPSASQIVSYANAGGLMGFGPDVAELYRRAAHYVDKILRGANPGDLAVEQPTRFELAINRKTARALGIALPQTLLLQANRVID